MRGCPFEADEQRPCPVQADSAVSSLFKRPCEADRYGRNCAAILTQLAVLRSTGSEGLESGIDSMYGTIVGHYQPTTITSGNAPHEVVEKITRCRFPIRSRRPTPDDGIAVHHFDLICTLWNDELLAAANWYNAYAEATANSGNAFNWWVFGEEDGAVTLLSRPKDTVAEYDQTFHLGSAVLFNAVNPPLAVVENLRRAARY